MERFLEYVDPSEGFIRYVRWPFSKVLRKIETRTHAGGKNRKEFRLRIVISQYICNQGILKEDFEPNGCPLSRRTVHWVTAISPQEDQCRKT